MPRPDSRKGWFGSESNLLAALSRLEVLTRRANIAVVFGIEDEIATAKNAVVVLGFVPYWNVRDDALFFD
ncbi:hypothetical protein [Massilia sp. UBA6681]|uniref:hypothetical protein n=1 Tax=Massilia sp. UBA6681 TaxID=1946839 RepID=UPI0025C6F702|nr:hypothetical protein [Massilia sp. UBA6681]